MTALLRRYPFPAALTAAATVVVAAAVLILPRLDGVEIRSAEPVTLADGRAGLRIRVAHRLASSRHGSLMVRTRAADGSTAQATVAVPPGYRETTVDLVAAGGASVVVAARLLPAGAGDGPLDQLFRGRREASRRVGPAAPSATEPPPRVGGN